MDSHTSQIAVLQDSDNDDDDISDSSSSYSSESSADDDDIALEIEIMEGMGIGIDMQNSIILEKLRDKKLGNIRNTDVEIVTIDNEGNQTVLKNNAVIDDMFLNNKNESYTNQNGIEEYVKTEPIYMTNSNDKNNVSNRKRKYDDMKQINTNKNTNPTTYNHTITNNDIILNEGVCIPSVADKALFLQREPDTNQNSLKYKSLSKTRKKKRSKEKSKRFSRHKTIRETQGLSLFDMKEGHIRGGAVVPKTYKRLYDKLLEKEDFKIYQFGDKELFKQGYFKTYRPPKMSSIDDLMKIIENCAEKRPQLDNNNSSSTEHVQNNKDFALHTKDISKVKKEDEKKEQEILPKILLPRVYDNTLTKDINTLNSFEESSNSYDMESTTSQEMIVKKWLSVVDANILMVIELAQRKPTKLPELMLRIIAQSNDNLI